MRNIFWTVSCLILIALIYYLWIRPFEFEVNFKAGTLPGDLIETLRIWNKSLDSAKIVRVDSLESLQQTIVKGKRSYVYNWRFASLNDTVVNVSVQISELNRGLVNKILIPFSEQPIERDASAVVNEFYRILNEHLKITRVDVKGESELDSTFCICTSLKTNQTDKAFGMMGDYPVLSSFINVHKLEANGPPMVKLTQWDHELGSLEFDFCFPVLPTDSLPASNVVRYRKFKNEKVLKAEYHGNYITSDRAWYALIQYAKEKGYQANGLPIEYFYDNPNLGVNEREWKANIYLPIK